MFSLILMLYELDHPYICTLGKKVMHTLKLSIMFATLEQLTAELLIILQVYPFIFWRLFSSFYCVYIHIHEYVNELLHISPLRKGTVS